MNVRRVFGPQAAPEASLRPAHNASPPERRRAQYTDGPLATVLAGALGMALFIWTMAGVLAGRAPLVPLAPHARVAGEVAVAIALAIGALLLLRLPEKRGRQRRRWLTMGLLLYGPGKFVLDGLGSLPDGVPNPNTVLYTSCGIATIAGALFALALLPARPPHFSRGPLLAVLAVFGGLCVVLVAGEGRLPPLAPLAAPAEQLRAPRPSPIGWHWLLTAPPCGLLAIATIGAARHVRRGDAGGWVLVGMTVLLGAHLQQLIWPATSAAALTDADLLRLAFGVVVVGGGIRELHGIAAQRAAVLEYNRRLSEVATLKADFTAMIAHELGSPLAAVRGFADMLATGDLPPQAQGPVLDAIRAETTRLNLLVADMRAAAATERDDFAVQPCKVPVQRLLADAVTFARTLPGDHPLIVPPALSGQVWADAGRVDQVLRNLLSNAAKYSPDGAPIELRARRAGRRIRIEVADRGGGIHPDDLPRIWEKFHRGRAARDRRSEGLGLGLYLSRRILQAHGADLEVDSRLGEGSVFGFELELIR